MEALLSSRDAFVDELWSGVVQRGAVLIAATFPRCYIDPNRAETDIDQDLLAEPWPGELRPEKYSRAGMGLIRRLALPGVPMYQRKLSVAEVQHRIDAYYRPYRAALKAQADAACRRFGAVWHVDCHSMKSRGNEMNTDSGQARPDVVVSDRLGSSADPAFTRWVSEELRRLGLSVQVNHPYQGGDLLNAISAPAQRRHSIQIELNRALYMDERTISRSPGFAALKSKLDAFADGLADYVRGQL